MHELPPLPYLSDDELFLSEVETSLRSAGIDHRRVLHRASEVDKRERLQSFGTDRGGYPGDRPWRGGVGLRHDDVILATTARQIRRGTTEPGFSTSAKKLPGIESPLWLVYDRDAFTHLGDKEYVFRPEVERRSALLAVFEVRKASLPRGWFAPEEGRAYRALAEYTLRRGGALVEVGCWLGRSTSYVARLPAARGARMICIDHFRGSTDRYDDEYRTALETEDVAAAFRAHLAFLGAEPEIICTPSVDAAATVPDRSVDLVLLDASHDETAVEEDLAAWTPKLRRGGILAGHDHDAEHPGVVNAVSHHARRRGATVQRGPGKIWWIEHEQ